jgi:hypothetical protein
MNEKKLFEKLKESIPDLKLADNKMSRWDCVSHERKLLIELKSRRTHYPTLLIEEKKYDAMISKADELGYEAYYINSTPEGVYSFNLHKVEIDFKVETKHPATTTFGKRSRVPKSVGYLCIETQGTNIKKSKEDK